MRIENLILSNLLFNEEYVRRVVVFLDDKYFSEQVEALLLRKTKEFIEKFNTSPTKETLVVELDKDPNVNENTFRDAVKYIDAIEYEEKNIDWMIERTEEFCKKKAVFNAIMESITIIEGQDQKRSETAIPSILQDALGVSFDADIGHNYLDDFEKRFEFYSKTEERIPFDLEWFNLITRGGLPRKTLSIMMGGTGAGKTLAMCHMAAANLLTGANVLYITMEMAEERIAERIDANLLDIPMAELSTIDREHFMNKIGRLKKKTTGKLFVKEYPTTAAGANHFRHLINDLKLKKGFFPDVVYVDYVNLCQSSRIRLGNTINSYSYVKAIAEELRGLAIEMNVAMISATQLNREGFGNSDPTLTDTSESFGLPQTVDFMGVFVTNEELDARGQILFKQLKNRFNDVSVNKKFYLGIDREKMRLYDIDDQSGEPDAPIMDASFGEEVSFKRGKKSFKGLFD